MGMFDFMAGQARTPTWDEVQRRRALADALAGSIGAPTTLGEGLSSIGAALGGVLANRKADRMDAARAVEADNVFEAALAGVPQDNSPLATALGGTFAAPTNAPPAAADALAPVKPAYGITPGAAGGAAMPTFDLSSIAVGGAARPDTFSGMNDEFRMGLASMVASAPDDVRAGIKISSGYRSPERQQKLWNEALQKYGSEAAARKWVAPPGRSNHNHGKAADIKFTTDAARDWAHANAAQYNLAFPLSNEPWHIELASARGGNASAPATASAPGPTAAAQAMPGFAPISIPAPPPVNVAMIRAMNNPYLSPEQRQILGSIMAQQQANQITPYQMAQLQMQQQEHALKMQQAMTPEPVKPISINGQLVNPMTGEVLGDYRDEASASGTEYGLQPQYGVDDQGNPVLIQIGKDGTAVQTALPDGVTFQKEPIRIDTGTEWVLLDPISRQPIGSVPKKLAEAEAEKAAGAAQGKATAEAQAGLSNAVAKADQAVGLLSAIRNDPALPGITGMFQGRIAPMTQAGTDLNTKIEQAKGQVFLEAFQSLKGGGAITEIEGKKAEQAIARMDRAQSTEAYKAALDELIGVIEAGKQRALQKAGQAAPETAAEPAGVSKRLRFNPATGELE